MSNTHVEPCYSVVFEAGIDLFKVYDKNTVTDDDFERNCRFIIELGKAAHGYGSSTARLESFLIRVAEAIGISGVYTSTPSRIEFAFSRAGQVWQQTHVVQLPRCDFNMAKLSYTGELVDDLTADKITLDDAFEKLDEIAAKQNPWGQLSYGLSYLSVAIGIAGLMQANLWEILASGVLSLVVYAIVVAAERTGGRFSEALPFVSAYVASVCATGTNLFVPELNPIIVTISAIIILIPGFQVSIGIIEIIDNRVEAGTTRLVNGLVYLVKQFTGAWLGIITIQMLGSSPAEFAVPTKFVMDHAVVGLFIALLFVGVAVAYQTLIRDLIWVLLSCTLTFTGGIVSSAFLGVEFSALTAAIVAGLFANTWVRMTGRPTSIVLVPSITVMVSGSIGFRGLVVAAAGHSDQGMVMFIQMFAIAASVGAGLLVSNTIMRPKMTL